LPVWAEVQVALAVAAFFVHTWAVRGFLHELPSFINYFPIGEILAVFAYMMMEAFLESLMVTTSLVLVGLALPKKWFMDSLPTNGFISLLIGAIAMIRLEDALLVDTRQLPPFSFYYAWGAITFSAWILAILLVSRIKSIQSAVRFLIERISILGYFYLFLGIVGIAVVVIRNLW
jgi:hypothetical protein